MVDLLPKCVECGCNVADSVEPEVERAAHLKLGHYVNSVNSVKCDGSKKFARAVADVDN